jgi:hypothetical protein
LFYFAFEVRGHNHDILCPNLALNTVYLFVYLHASLFVSPLACLPRRFLNNLLSCKCTNESKFYFVIFLFCVALRVRPVNWRFYALPVA